MKHIRRNEENNKKKLNSIVKRLISLVESKMPIKEIGEE